VLVASITSTDPIQQAAFPIILVFVGTTGALGFKANRSFRQQVLLRIRTEELAEDLARQKDIAERANLAKSTFLAAASHDLRQPVHALGLLAGALRGVAIPVEGAMLLDQIEASTNAMDGYSPRCSTSRVLTPASLRFIGGLSPSDPCSLAFAAIMRTKLEPRTSPLS
jgi:signal transduction histidine kinase